MYKKSSNNPKFKITFFRGDGDYVVCRRILGLWIPIHHGNLIATKYDEYYLRFYGDCYHTHVVRITQALVKSKGIYNLIVLSYAN